MEAQTESMINAQVVLSDPQQNLPSAILDENLILITTITTRVLEMSTGKLPPHALEGMDILWELEERAADLMRLMSDSSHPEVHRRQMISDSSEAVVAAMKKLIRL